MQTTFSVTYGDGWYPVEHDGVRPFRWTGPGARLAIALPAPVRMAWLRLACGVWGAAPSAPLLSVSVNGRDVGRRRVNPHLGYLSFPLGEGREFEVALQPDGTFSVPGDERALGVMVKGLDVFDEDDLACPLELEGWFERERHEYFPFSWMGGQARSLVPGLARADARFVTLPIAAETGAGRQVLTVSQGARQVAELPLLRGWHLYDVDLRAGKGEGPPEDPDLIVLGLRLNALCPPEACPGDPRVLGVRIGPIEVHADRRRHGFVRVFHEAGPITTPAAPEGPATDICCGLPAVGERGSIACFLTPFSGM